MSDEGNKSSWLEPLPAEYANDEDAIGRRMLIAGLTVVILAIFGGLIWYSYMAGRNDGPVPVIRADNSVVKEKPDTVGGLIVPDQDKRVFNRVASEEPSKDEKLSPSAELPVDRPNSETELAPIESVVDKVVQPVVETLETASTTVEKSKPVAQIKPAIGNLLVQLGAFSKKETAEQLWLRLKKDNANILGDYDLNIMMVDLGKKGMLYRLRGGFISDRSEANKICAALKAKKQPCIVVSK